MSAHHEMLLVGSTESGAEEWLCPHCGRRMLLRWRPTYEKLVITPGDEWVLHAGGKGAARMGQVRVESVGIVEDGEAMLRWLTENGVRWDDDRRPTDR
jgi:hypothetical protein